MRALIIFVFGMLVFSTCAMAQDADITSATSALQDVLSNLKQSVDRLSFDNDQWTARDNAVKAQIAQLQTQLATVEAQGELLNQAADKLQDKNPPRSQQISRLEEENVALDNRALSIQNDINLTQQSLQAGYHEDQQLLLQLKGEGDQLVQPPLVKTVESPEAQAAFHRQKEKLRLMKMIYDSQQRQEAMHQSILDIQKNSTLQPAAHAMAHQQLLKEQIKDLEGQIAVNPPISPSSNGGSAFQWDDKQMRQLEEELKALESNYAQLKDLMEKMTKKAQGAKLTASQKSEEEKLQSSIDDLNHQTQGLRADLDDLRSQMVDLDKRKTRLESMIQHLP